MKIAGSAPECNRSIEGSGFVYAPQHVITVAHAVAGLAWPTVTTADGGTYRARVVFYDPRTDIAVLRAEGTSIYQVGHVDRQVYEIRAAVQPGDSGGPLLSPGGTVDGMLQAMRDGGPDTGFALTAAEIQPDAQAAATATAPVSTQGCL